MPAEPLRCNVAVIGDEVESILTAVSAARAGAGVALIRESGGDLGGLSTRGGLCYMDITPEHLAPLFGEFLKRAGVVRIALNRERAASVLEAMIDESRIDVYGGVSASAVSDGNRVTALQLSDGRMLSAEVVIDATPDGDIARQLGVPFIRGLGGLLGESNNYLGVTPVFRIEGVSCDAMRQFEADLRARPETPEMLRQALPHKTPAEIDELVHRPTYAPDDMDYLDILNPAIGVWYHVWRHGEASSYPKAKIYIDGGNVARLADETLGFNGLITRIADDPAAFDKLLAWSHGAPMPPDLADELAHVARFLREEGGFPDATVIPPDELYVRQTVTLLSRNNMTAEAMLRGGVSPERAVGTFSYWLDLRGAELWRHYGTDAHFPKPVFNVGLDAALPLWPQLENVAFVGRSAGYSPIGQGAGRIIQHNAMLGEALGIAAALAARSGCPLPEMAETGLPVIRDILADRQGAPVAIQGRATLPEADIHANSVLKADREAIESLRRGVAEASGIL